MPACSPAREFLDADPYNAAKHGLAICAAAQQWRVDVDGEPILTADGASLDWVAVSDDEDGRRRWTRTSQILSVEATVIAVHAATRLMAGIWDGARLQLLGDEREPFAGLADVETSYATLCLRHHVIADMYRPLAYGGDTQRVLRVSTRHLGPGAPRNQRGDADHEQPYESPSASRCLAGQTPLPRETAAESRARRRSRPRSSPKRFGLGSSGRRWSA